MKKEQLSFRAIPEAELFVGLKGVIKRLPCTFSLKVDGTGQSKGTCQQEGAPQRKIAAVSGAGAGSALDEDGLDGMGAADILKGVGLHRANALAVNLDIGNSIALIRGDGEGLITTLTNADIAGGRNGAASPSGCLDGVVAVVPTTATAGLVIQLNLAGQGRVVVIIRREAPFVGRVGLDRGIVGQGLALVIHPFQLAVTGIQSASLDGQRHVL